MERTAVEVSPAEVAPIPVVSTERGESINNYRYILHRAKVRLSIKVVRDIHTYGLYTKGTRARTHRELIREWLREPKESSLEHI